MRKISETEFFTVTNARNRWTENNNIIVTTLLLHNYYTRRHKIKRKFK